MPHSARLHLGSRTNSGRKARQAGKSRETFLRKAKTGCPGSRYRVWHASIRNVQDWIKAVICPRLNSKFTIFGSQFIRRSLNLNTQCAIEYFDILYLMRLEMHGWFLRRAQLDEMWMVQMKSDIKIKSAGGVLNTVDHDGAIKAGSHHELKADCQYNDDVNSLSGNRTLTLLLPKLGPSVLYFHNAELCLVVKKDHQPDNTTPGI